MSDLITDVLAGGVRGGTAIMLAALGETLAERAGVVNLGTEGCLLVGALTGYAVAAESGNPWLGLAAGALAGAGLALVHAVLVVWRGADQFATGLTLMFLGLGLTSLFGAAYVASIINSFTIWKVPLLSKIPWVGEILFQHDPLTYLSFVLVPVAWFVLQRTGVGLLVRGAGERSEVLATYGHDVRLVQYLAVVTGGFLAGVGGAQLSTAYANSWFENMTQGRGFVAVAVVIFAARRPLAAMGGSYLFGAALALSPALQARGWHINQFALDSLPYIAVLVVLVLLGKKRAAEAPEGLQKVFELSTS
jgi:simple sugar transport system permease protein